MVTRDKQLASWSWEITYSCSDWNNMSGGMTAIKGLSPWVFRRELKPDTCLVTPALVYRGSHPSSNLKSWGLHLAIRPSSSRWSIQCAPMTVGGRVSLAAHLKWKVGEESNTFWVTFFPSSRLRSRARTSWTSGRSFLYSSNRALRRAASEGSVEVVASASSASDSFCTLEGVAPSLEPVVVALWSRFRSLRESLTLRLQRGCSSSGVGSLALSESVLEASLICSWTC